MKVKEKLGDERGRPRKFAPGDEVRWGLRMPEDLLMELRISARVAGHSINDEMLSRLMASLNYKPKKETLDSLEGKRLVTLARYFAEFIESKVVNLEEELPDSENDKN